MKDHRMPRILNVDDNDAIRYTTTRILRRAGFAVQEAATGRDALRLAEEGPDLILLDVQLPDISGLEVCRQIKANPRTAAIPVVHLSATFVDADDQATGMEQGADGYLTHPVDPKVLVATVNAFLRLKTAEQALRESEEKFRQLFTRMPSAVAIYDAVEDGEDFIFQDFNTAAEKIEGIKKDDLIGKRVTKVFPGVKDFGLFTVFQRVWRTGQPEFFPSAIYRDKRDRGTWRESWVYKLANGEVIAIYHDVTERKQIEEALQKSEARYRLIAENSSDAIWTMNLDGKFTYISPTVFHLRGYTADEVMRQPLEEQVAPGSLRLALDELGTLLEKGRQGIIEPPTMIEVEQLRKDGSTVWTEISGELVKDEANDSLIILGVMRNIVERKQLEERIRQVRGDLLAAVSHDLKSPFQTLRQTQEVLGQLPPAEALVRFQEYNEIWRRNLQRLERMINNLVDSQRGEEDRFPLLLALCNPAELVQQVAEDLTGYALVCEVQFDLKIEQVPEGSCDKEALARVVENLLTNAVKFSPKGGRVEVCLRMEDQTLLLEVKDHGAGIPAEEQAQLFQPFQRGLSAHQKGIPGSGLGLYVCRRIVEEHGGTITLTSEEGKGTKATVRLPWG